MYIAPYITWHIDKHIAISSVTPQTCTILLCRQISPPRFSELRQHLPKSNNIWRRSPTGPVVRCLYWDEDPSSVPPARVPLDDPNDVDTGLCRVGGACVYVWRTWRLHARIEHSVQVYEYFCTRPTHLHPGPAGRALPPLHSPHRVIGCWSSSSSVVGDHAPSPSQESKSPIKICLRVDTVSWRAAIGSGLARVSSSLVSAVCLFARRAYM